MAGKMSMGLDLEILLKFPNVVREPGSFIIFVFLLLFYHTFPSLYIFISSHSCSLSRDHSLFSLWSVLFSFFRFLLPMNSRLH
jgi:hypothetical protein